MKKDPYGDKKNLGEPSSKKKKERPGKKPAGNKLCRQQEKRGGKGKKRKNVKQGRKVNKMTSSKWMLVKGGETRRKRGEGKNGKIVGSWISVSAQKEGREKTEKPPKKARNGGSKE